MKFCEYVNPTRCWIHWNECKKHVITHKLFPTQADLYKAKSMNCLAVGIQSLQGHDHRHEEYPQETEIRDKKIKAMLHMIFKPFIINALSVKLLLTNHLSAYLREQAINLSEFYQILSRIFRFDQ